MICFLTSMPVTDSETGAFADVNGFMTELKTALTDNCRMLFVCSDPGTREVTDYYARELTETLGRSGISFSALDVLDDRSADNAPALVRSADFIVLAGGHVPTQNRFFNKIGLKALLDDFGGVLMGISAGSMNSAETVYAQPELEGEAVDPGYKRFLLGLGLTKTMLLPHYQSCKDDMLDGLRVYEDITYPDSFGREFIAIPDGSFLLLRDGAEELRGEAYRIKDGVLTAYKES